MSVFVAVPGTHASRRPAEWSDSNSPLSVFLGDRGVFNVSGTVKTPYFWSTDIDLSEKWDWIAGGYALFYYLVPPIASSATSSIPPEQTVVISHSHGRQVVLYALSKGLKIDRWIDIAGPVRADMKAVSVVARKNVRRWMHVHSDHTDRWQWLGELFDGHFGIVRKCPFADINLGIPGVGHGGMLRDPNDFHLWNDLGMIDFLKDASNAK